MRSINSLSNDDYTNQHDDLLIVVAIWRRKFSETVHMMIEGYYMWQHHILTGGTVVIAGRPFFENVDADSLKSCTLNFQMSFTATKSPLVKLRGCAM